MLHLVLPMGGDAGNCMDCAGLALGSINIFTGSPDILGKGWYSQVMNIVEA